MGLRRAAILDYLGFSAGLLLLVLSGYGIYIAFLGWFHDSQIADVASWVGPPVLLWITIIASRRESWTWIKADSPARMTALATVFIAIFTIVLACVSIHQGQIMRQQLETADRPWVGISSLDVARPLARNAAMQVNVHTRNWGKSPALYVIPHAVLVAVHPPETVKDIVNKYDRTCLKPEPSWTDKGEGSMYFPDENDAAFGVVSQSTDMSANQIDFLNAVPGATSAPFPSLGLWLVSCLSNMCSMRAPLTANLARNLAHLSAKLVRRVL